MGGSPAVVPGRDPEITERRAGAPSSDEVVSRYPAARRRIDRRTRRRRAAIGLGLGLAATAVAVVIMLPQLILRLDPPELREVGEWHFTHVVEPADSSWAVVQRILEADREYTMVAIPDPGGTTLTCVVTLTRGSLPDGVTSTAQPVRVRHRSGFYVDDPSDQPKIVWVYAEGALAGVSCYEDVPEATLLTVAEAVDFDDSRVRLPFLVDTLPTGFHISSIDERRSGAGVAVTLTPEARSAMPSVTVWAGSENAGDRCLPAAATRAEKICLTSARTVQDAPYPPGRIQQAMDAVEATLRLAADPADRSTWFDAVDLPR
jgi:hypothetical protein